MEVGTTASKVKAVATVGQKLGPTDYVSQDGIFKSLCGIKNM